MESDRISAAVALRMVAKAIGDESKSKEVIRSWAAMGKLSVQAQCLYTGLAGVRDAEVPRTFWNDLDTDGSDWGLGNLHNMLSNERSMSVTAISFSRVEVEELVSYLCADTPPEKRTSPGGRPRKEWWDDLWVEMCRQLYLGDLKPKRQVDIEKAMLEWLGSHHPGSDIQNTIRPAARKLWTAIRDENSR